MKILVLLCFGVATIIGSRGADANSPYRFHLEETDHTENGRVGVDAVRGQRVVADVDEAVDEHEGATEEKYLQVSIRVNPRKPYTMRQSTKNMDIYMTTEPPRTQTTGSSIHETTSDESEQRKTSQIKPAPLRADDVPDDSADPKALPLISQRHGHGQLIHLTHHSFTHAQHGSGVESAVVKRSISHVENKIHPSHLKYYIEDTSAFYIDPIDRFIKVNNTTELEDQKSIRFYVYLIDDKGIIVSNPVPFTIYIERPTVSDAYPMGPAIFAGVLVLIIVFLALFIPFVTRAKRRFRQGKPVFKMGSHPSSLDLEKAATMSRVSSEPEWYGNNAFYNYEEEVTKERKDFSKGIKQYAVDKKDTLQLTKKSKETSSLTSGSSGIDVSSQYAEGTSADEVMSQRL